MQRAYEAYTALPPRQIFGGKNSIEVGHRIDLKTISTLGLIMGCMDHIMKEAKEM
jgi:hypothetical protein